MISFTQTPASSRATHVNIMVVLSGTISLIVYIYDPALLLLPMLVLNYYYLVGYAISLIYTLIKPYPRRKTILLLHLLNALLLGSLYLPISEWRYHWHEENVQALVDYSLSSVNDSCYISIIKDKYHPYKYAYPNIGQREQAGLSGEEMKEILDRLDDMGYSGIIIDTKSNIVWLRYWPSLFGSKYSVFCRSYSDAEVWANMHGKRHLSASEQKALLNDSIIYTRCTGAPI